jgi:thiol-disulfide isomerase/thioredoxin
MNRLTKIACVIPLALLVAPPVWALAPDYTLSSGFSADSGTLTLTAQAPTGHHFNLDAPAQASASSGDSAQKPTLKTPQQVRFVFNAPAPGTYTTQLYLCDDALTYCEKKVEQIRFSASATSASAGKPGSVQPGPASPEKGVIEEAFRRAQKERRPLMVDFYGIWCPPCNMLNEKVFSQPAFKRRIRDFIEVKIDVDTPQAWSYTARYKISGYPTVLFLTPDAEEISRILGYRPLAQFLKSMKAAYALRDGQALAALQGQAEKGDRAAMDHLGLIELGRENFAEAVRYLQATTRCREKLWDARIALAEERANDGDSAAKQQLTEARRQAIEEFPDSPDSIERRTDLAESLDKKEEARPVYLDALATAKKLVKKPPESLVEYDSSVADIWEQIAETESALGDAKGEKLAYQTAAAEFKKELVTANDRGVNLELAYSLWKSGNDAAAREIYGRLQKAYPDDFTFYNNQARMELALDKLDAAEPLARRAVSLSYGSNHLEASLVLAKILKAQKKIDQARAVIDQAMTSPSASTAVPENKNVRYYRSLQRLSDYKKKELS